MKRIFLTPAMLLLCATSLLAVTTREMDRARAIAAKEYLRYSNNGSGYLDEVKFTSMAELEAALKPKEKENLAAFKKIAAPSDFASWDKEKLVEYWGSTFFKSAGLSEKGKGARSVVARKVRALDIAAPKEEEPAPAEAADAPAIAPEDQTPAPAQPTPEEIQARLKATEDSLAALAQPETEDEAAVKSDGGTTLYIVILAILIAIVIGLVVYASRLFGAGKKQEGDDDGFETDRHSRALDSLSETVAARDAEIRSLRRQLDDEKERVRELEARIDSLSRKAERAALAEPPVQRRRERVIYLARAGRQGIFTRADKEPQEDVSVFRLVTTDGVTGTFDIIDDERVIDAIMDSPEALLANAATADIPQDMDQAEGIETHTAGTAVFEDGKWRVVRKARLAFV